MIDHVRVKESKRVHTCIGEDRDHHKNGVQRYRIMIGGLCLGRRAGECSGGREWPCAGAHTKTSGRARTISEMRGSYGQWGPLLGARRPRRSERLTLACDVKLLLEPTSELERS